ncbi:hypothetical protein [Agrobacterium pusense]|jgi:hypothetical protein|uniref:hypothetical protein n=1 Tax=Agrobacterium pusense TaxID=648995 RepID=UPI002452A880|nr:hypothetical protein [Agrobacterium pusense]
MIFRQTVTLLLAISLSPISALADCGMTLGWENEGTSTVIYKDLRGTDTSRYSVFYQAKAAINTDGAPRSYHPDDAAGDRNLALNTIANAMEPRPYDRVKKQSIPCPSGGDGNCFSKWIAAFENAKASNFSIDADWWVRFSDIIPTNRTKLGEDIPCVQDSNSPAPGYYVSATHATWERGNKCKQSIYVDASKYNGNVLPGKSAWGRPGRPTDSFDLVVMMQDGGIPIYGINFDSGPEKEIGEISIAAAAALRGVDLANYQNYKAIKSLALTHVNYLIFPEVDIKRIFKGRFTQQQLNEFGAQVFREWGGVDRLAKCAELPRLRR